MLRRVAVAFIIVSLSMFNFFQIQLTVLMTSFFIIYQGWVKPFKGKKRNKLEFTNETLILINTYFLFMYSDFVYSPDVRYQMGWVNLTFLGLMLLINVGMMILDVFGSFKEKMRQRRLKKLKK